MKRNMFVLITFLSVFILLSTPVFAGTFHLDELLSFEDRMIEYSDNQKEQLFPAEIDFTDGSGVLNFDEGLVFNNYFDRGSVRLIFSKLFLTYPGLFTSFMFVSPVVSKDFLNYAYDMGLKISETLDISEIKALLRYTNFKNLVNQDEIEEISDLDCDCFGNNKENIFWFFPISCTILYFVFIFLFFAWVFTRNTHLLILVGTVRDYGEMINCWWT